MQPDAILLVSKLVSTFAYETRENSPRNEFFLLTKRVLTKWVFFAHETSAHETIFFVAHETSAHETSVFILLTKWVLTKRVFFAHETSAHETRLNT